MIEIKGYRKLRKGLMVCFTAWQVLLMRGQESLPALPKHQWVFMVGPSWTQAYNEETNFKFFGDNQLLWAESPSFYRRLQPYVGIERLTHIGDRWVYSVAMSYHERYTDNLKVVKYLVRSVNIELQGGLAVTRRNVRKPMPYYFVPNADTLTNRWYFTAGMYLGHILAVREYYGNGEVQPYNPWDIGVKIRLFGQYYKYREDQRFLSVQFQFGLGMSLVRLYGYYLVTNYLQHTVYGSTAWNNFLLPVFRLSWIM